MHGLTPSKIVVSLELRIGLGCVGACVCGGGAGVCGASGCSEGIAGRGRNHRPKAQHSRIREAQFKRR